MRQRICLTCFSNDSLAIIPEPSESAAFRTRSRENALLLITWISSLFSRQRSRDRRRSAIIHATPYGFGVTLKTVPAGEVPPPLVCQVDNSMGISLPKFMAELSTALLRS
jgi:hypothetical protein